MSAHTVILFHGIRKVIILLFKKNARAGGIFCDLLSKLLPQTAEIVDTTLTPINNFEYKNNFSKKKKKKNIKEQKFSSHRSF